MQEAISTVVDVTVSEWPAAVVTGVVGLAGILATYLQGKRGQRAASQNLTATISAENERVRLAEKRRVYAAYHGAISRFFAERKFTVSSGTGSAPPYNDESLAAVYRTWSEASMVAPPDISALIRELTKELFAYTDSLDHDRSITLSRDWVAKRDKLLSDMRADLGEPVESA
jgi:hypothetical protein